MAKYGTVPRAAPPSSHKVEPHIASSRMLSDAPRRRTVVLCGVLLVGLSLLLSAHPGALHIRSHAFTRAAADMRSEDGVLARMAAAEMPRGIGGSAGCASYRNFGRFDGAEAELVRCVFEHLASETISRAEHAGAGEHNGHEHHHHHHHHHHHGGNAFFSWPLGHPASPHSFNYACHMPPLQTCIGDCRAQPSDGKPRWPCFMNCALSNCFVIGKACAKPQFDKCAATCKGQDAFVECAKTCFNGECPAPKEGEEETARPVSVKA